MSGTIISITVVYLVICILIGIWATGKTKTTGDFLVAGKNLGMFVMAIAAFSSIQSGFGMLGGTGLTFSGGMGFLAGVGIAAPLGFALTWFIVGKRMWKVGELGEIYTLGDVVERRYNSKAVRGWIGFATILGVIGYLGTQVQAMGIIMHTIFGVSPMVGALIGLAILGFYCVGGGIIAGVYTDLFQGIIMVIVSVLIFFIALHTGGGVHSITESLKSSDVLMASPFGTYSMVSIVCWIFLFSFGAAGQPHFITKFLMVKNQRELKWGAFTAGFSYTLSTLLVIGIGLTARALFIRGEFPKLSSPDEALTVFLTEFSSPFVSGLVIAGLLAAIMSTGSSFVTLGSSSLTRDIPKAFNKKIKNELLWNRIAVVALLVISTLFSFYMDTLVALLGVFGWGTFASALFPAVVLGLVWKKATKYGAIASIIVGLVLNFVLEICKKYGIELLPPGVIVGAVAFAGSIILFIVVSLFTQKSNRELDKDLVDAMEG